MTPHTRRLVALAPPGTRRARRAAAVTARSAAGRGIAYHPAVEFGLGRKRVLQGASVLLAFGAVTAVAVGVAMLLDRLPMKNPTAARKLGILAFLLLFPSAFWLL